jgi:hypothetical protein
MDQILEEINQEKNLKIKENWEGIERRGVLNKYKCALLLLGCQEFDETHVVYGDAGSLVQLRNALIHSNINSTVI